MSVTMEQLDALAAEVSDLTRQKRALNSQIKDIDEELTPKAYKLQKWLEENKRDGYESPKGKFTIVTTHYFGVEDEKKLREWLKEDGTFDAVITVNTTKLTNRVKELVMEDGPNGKPIPNPELIPIGVKHSPKYRLNVTPRGT